MDITPDVFRKIREVHRLPQAYYGKLLGISVAQVNRIERDKRRLTEAIKRRLITEFMLTPETLAELLEIHERYKVKE
ncbi:helix-turn-helix domain-containing protein [Fictibacillus nanhaiensis]|uniref:helix-turn-helix domain-containing protein n=1 Tax=Fictibacillus nanhaiensis TaxID=742169 RepID=UPI003C29F006